MTRLAVILLGAPGSGKGTQSAKLVETFNLVHISTGDILRHAIAAETPVGKEAKAYVDAGDLVPDETIIKLIQTVLTEDVINQGFLLDGFPRTLNQAKLLDGLLQSLNTQITNVLYFDISLEETIERISGRRLCMSCNAIYHVKYNPPRLCGEDCTGDFVQRSDDTEEKIKHRFSVFLEQTKPLCAHYGSFLQTIDASQSESDIFSAVSADLESTHV
tara:strand:+ start:358 stop:1008 length:651 start_codon:yes stop_codon:yes gene_type:complete